MRIETVSFVLFGTIYKNVLRREEKRKKGEVSRVNTNEEARWTRWTRCDKLELPSIVGFVLIAVVSSSPVLSSCI
jgi:hypothetical protein